MTDWILNDPTATNNMMTCAGYVATVGKSGLFSHDSEHASFQTMAPLGTVRLSHTAGELFLLFTLVPSSVDTLPEWRPTCAQSRHVSPPATPEPPPRRLPIITGPTTMRDPIDQFELPDHVAWQMNLAIERSNVSPEDTGILGETLVPIFDESCSPIMQGTEAVRGRQEECASQLYSNIGFDNTCCSIMSSDSHHTIGWSCLAPGICTIYAAQRV